MTNSNRYANGYLPKIAYHLAHGNQDNVDYFKQRQIATYGRITTEQWMELSRIYADICNG
jgi:hypothetical protein